MYEFEGFPGVGLTQDPGDKPMNRTGIVGMVKSMEDRQEHL